ncbi:carbohydrate porin, partial [uncultured Pseudomonas sp.]
MSFVFRLSPAPITAGLLLVLASNGAMAEADLLRRSTFTGDWGGLRHQLEDNGVKFSADYSGETAYNADGGLHRSARYSQNIKLGVQFDLSRLYGLDNAGKVQLSINDRRGHSASEELVGNRLPIQEN